MEICVWMILVSRLIHREWVFTPWRTFRDWMDTNRDDYDSTNDFFVFFVLVHSQGRAQGQSRGGHEPWTTLEN
jgi:hypothetical protein